MKTPLEIFVLALAVVLFACASPAAASDITIHNGEIFTIASGDYFVFSDTLTINPGGTLVVENGGTLALMDGTINNYGTINNCGSIELYYASDSINNYGIFNNGGYLSHIDGLTFNYGTFNNYEGGGFGGYAPVGNPIIELPYESPYCAAAAVPTFTPLGLLALVSALSALAVLTMRRKRL